MKLTLHLTVGVPASGKSTYAKEYCARHLIDYLSSDELRARFGTSEQDQTVSGQVFRFIETEIHKYMSEGRDLFIDATNVSRKARGAHIRIAREYGAKVTAHVSMVPLDECKRRNAARDRVVPDFVLERMHAGFELPTIGEVDSILWVRGTKRFLE